MSASSSPANEIVLPGYKQEGWWTRFKNRVEKKISTLSTKNNFWHRFIAWKFLPLAYRSGIRFHKADESTFSAVLPFKKFNRNWYNAMAGGALLGNAEVAGGMYIFKKAGADYTVVCKHLEYTFRRPCVGPAIYRIEPRADLDALIAAGGEFNITVDITIMQQITKGEDKKPRRVGGSVATFHVAPKEMMRARRERKKAQLAANKAASDAAPKD